MSRLIDCRHTNGSTTDSGAHRRLSVPAREGERLEPRNVDGPGGAVNTRPAHDLQRAAPPRDALRGGAVPRPPPPGAAAEGSCPTCGLRGLTVVTGEDVASPAWETVSGGIDVVFFTEDGEVWVSTDSAAMLIPFSGITFFPADEYEIGRLDFLRLPLGT